METGNDGTSSTPSNEGGAKAGGGGSMPADWASFDARYGAGAGEVARRVVAAEGGAGQPGAVPLPPVAAKVVARLLRLPCDLLVAGTGDELWNLDEDEIEILRDSVAHVAEAHAVQLDPKRQAWGILAVAILAIYGGRLAEWRAKKAMPGKVDAVA